MGLDRAGGTSSGGNAASGNPPAFFFSVDISYAPIIDDLASRGFADARTGETAFMLQRVSRQHMQPYLNVALKFPSGDFPSVKEAHDILVFDRRLQSVLFKYIGVFETQFRAQYAHLMECESGEMALYDSSLFLRPANYEKSRKHFDVEAERKSKRHGTPEWAASRKNDDRLPVCVGVECMTLGTLSQFYANTRSRRVTDGVAESFGCSKAELSSWARTVCDVRNICAHFDSYVTRRQIPSVPLRIDGLKSDNNVPFHVVYILLSLLSYEGLFGDMNLLYAERMRREVVQLVRDFSSMYGHLLGPLGIPGSWEEDMIHSADGRTVELTLVSN